MNGAGDQENVPENSADATTNSVQKSPPNSNSTNPQIENTSPPNSWSCRLIRMNGVGDQENENSAAASSPPKNPPNLNSSNPKSPNLVNSSSSPNLWSSRLMRRPPSMVWEGKNK
jgi:hypothetical protein